MTHSLRRHLFVLVASLVAVATPVRAADFLYVGTNGHTILRYDISQGTSAAIKATETVFANRTTYPDLTSPYGLALDGQGNLYAGDQINVPGSSIPVFSPSGALLATWGVGDVSNPMGLTFNSSGTLYVANTSLINHAYKNTIAKFDSSGNFLGRFNSNGNFPYGMAFNSQGNLYVANRDSNTVSIYNSSDVWQSNITTNLTSPHGLAFSPTGDLYVVNNGLVSRFNSAGVFQNTITGNMNNPIGIGFDDIGNFYVANQGTGIAPNTFTIAKFNSAGVFQFSWILPSQPLMLVVPEPSTFLLGAVASGALALLSRRKKLLAARR